ncbi:unnamed protein product [Spirodela intermedia]|uniref:Uncharacterized protein n=1 Tax=Spirodela intermedia TaxID=51605 RepID=A0A7I8J0V5_SPIIN|nr:unnamed protein product [Spirodela intermedia]CAA6663602.1 unnamed protein product [Spirodela intermedia]
MASPRLASMDVQHLQPVDFVLFSCPPDYGRGVQIVTYSLTHMALSLSLSHTHTHTHTHKLTHTYALSLCP